LGEALAVSLKSSEDYKKSANVVANFHKDFEVSTQSDFSKDRFAGAYSSIFLTIQEEMVVQMRRIGKIIKIHSILSKWNSTL
jgi:hypothetical protein